MGKMENINILKLKTDRRILQQRNDYMKHHKYQKSMSFFDLGFLHSTISKATGPVVTKLHVEPPGAEDMKICSNGPDHMAKMAAMPIYD